MKQTKNMKT